MEAIQESIQKLNMPHHLKMRIKNFIESQQEKNWQESKSYSESENYKCKKCNDRTFILEGNEAIPCECRELRKAEAILENSGISKEFRKKRFLNFNYSYSKQTMEAFVIAKQYTKEFKNIAQDRNNSIIFMGQVGSGKTFLSLAIANELMENQVGVIYMPYREIITKIKQSILDSENYNREMKRYKNAKVLLIDDMFKGNITPSDINIMFELINHRYFNNMPIIVSTEKTIDDLLKIDEAIGSRILEMSKDRRIEMKGKQLNYRIYG